MVRCFDGKFDGNATTVQCNNFCIYTTVRVYVQILYNKYLSKLSR